VTGQHSVVKCDVPIEVPMCSTEVFISQRNNAQHVTI